MNASSGRDDRRQQLVEEIDEHQSRADAFDTLAQLIEETPVPVGRYEEIWSVVVERLRSDSSRSLTMARHCQSRLFDLDEAQSARDRWIPQRAT